jgi:DNA-binding NarL/FixJ family response regulator
MMLTTFDDDDYVKHAMQAGANGYVMKNIDADELIAYIFAINKGTHLMSPSIGTKYFGQSSESPGAAGDKQQPAEKIDYLQTRFPDLKRREAEVLFHILQGLNNNQIAELLFISKNTVNNYTSTIYAKIGVDDRLHAIQLLGHIG